MNTKIIKELEKNPTYLKTVYTLSKGYDEELSHMIREELSLNENTPVDVLEKLIKDDDVKIRLNTIKLKSTSDNIISSALKDIDASVRLQVLKSHEVSEDALIALFSDSDTEVVQLARKILKARL